MAIGVLDLSIVTDRLIALLKQGMDNTRLWPPEGGGTRPNITVTGNAPDYAFDQGGCQLCVFLFHVAPSKHHVNTPPTVSMPVTQGSFPPVQYEPLGLELYYLLTAHSAGAYVEEQQVMSVAMKWLHDNPVVKAAVPDGGREELFRITIETETYDTLGRLWQATTKPLRLAVVYRASVVFLEPEEQPADAKPVEAYGLTAGPAVLPLGEAPEIVSTTVTVRYQTPTGATKSVDRSPAVVGPGQTFRIYGQMALAQRVLLVPVGGAPAIDITSWSVGGQATSNRLVLRAPTVGVPEPQVFSLVVADAAGQQSNAVPFAIAPTVSDAGGPLLVFAGVPLALVGTGFTAGHAEVIIGATSLAEVAGVPAAGQVAIADAEHLTFMPPTAFPSGTYAVRVRVNGVEAAPAKWVQP